MRTSIAELDQAELGKARAAEKLTELEKVPGKISSWVRSKIADLYNTNLGYAYVPESLIDDIPVFRAVDKRKLGKMSGKDNYWYIGTANREPAIEAVTDYRNKYLILVRSTIGGLKKAGKVTVRQNGLSLKVEGLKRAEPYKIVDKAEYQKEPF